MKSKMIKFMIDNKYLAKNSLIHATINAPGLGGFPVQVDKDLLFDEYAQSSKGAIYVKGCDPENLQHYVIGASKIHELNGMDEETILRLYPEYKSV